jgi:hypothetical protein
MTLLYVLTDSGKICVKAMAKKTPAAKQFKALRNVLLARKNFHWMGSMPAKLMSPIAKT